MEEALVLARFADEVVVIHCRDEFRASKIMVDRVRRNPRIGFLTGAVVEEILGEYSVEGVRLRLAGGQARTLRIDGLFLAVGYRPASDLFRDQMEKDVDGYVIQKEKTMTSVPGVFAAGEGADEDYRQIATAVGSGYRAAIDAQRWLRTRPPSR
jgi:thioredoxin reductase (NADPH)